MGAIFTFQYAVTLTKSRCCIFFECYYGMFLSERTKTHGIFFNINIKNTDISKSDNWQVKFNILATFGFFTLNTSGFDWLVILDSNTFQLLLGDPERLPCQDRICNHSLKFHRHPLRWTCLENLQREAPRRHPNKMPKAPQATALDAKEQRLFSELALQMSELLILTEESQYGHLYPNLIVLVNSFRHRTLRSYPWILWDRIRDKRQPWVPHSLKTLSNLQR